MLKAHVIVICAIILFGSTGALAVEGCSNGDQNINDNGSAVFGLRWDGTMIGAGQSFDLDCAAQFQTASFEFTVIEGGSSGGQPYLLSTDIMIMELMDTSFNILATTSAPLGFSNGTQWTQFDMTDQNVILQPGTYIVGCRTEAPRLAGVAFDTEDTHTGNRAWYWIDEWINSGPGSDNCFQATWDPDAVPAEKVSWSSMKASYR